MQARVYVTLKEGILDPQGVAVSNALKSLGYRGIDDVKVGKFIELNLPEVTVNEAPALVDEVCRRLLANPVIEKYDYELVDDKKNA